MKYLFDTNICIHFLRGKYGLIEKFEQLGTYRFEIWHWFDEKLPNGIAEYAI
jgi:hypothetical protein